MLAGLAEVRLLDGRRAIVRNGYLQEREIHTGVVPGPVQVPKMRGRSGPASSSMLPGAAVGTTQCAGSGGAILVLSQGHLQRQVR